MMVYLYEMIKNAYKIAFCFYFEISWNRIGIVSSLRFRRMFDVYAICAIVRFFVCRKCAVCGVNIIWMFSEPIKTKKKKQK